MQSIKFVDREKKLVADISELLDISVSLRDQIDALEQKEAEIAEKISMKQRQLDIIRLERNVNGS